MTLYRIIKAVIKYSGLMETTPPQRELSVIRLEDSFSFMAVPPLMYAGSVSFTFGMVT